jgi:thiol-disulfide isomerase/thioredoxin
MRFTGDVPSTAVSATILLGLVVVVTTIGMIWRARNGKLREQPDDGEVFSSSDLALLGATLGERATLLQFSSAFCAPCRTTRVVLGEVSQAVAGVVHVEVDAESHLDLVRRFDIMRTPTVLVLDAEGRIVKRASGAPRKADVLAALDARLPAAGDVPG